MKQESSGSMKVFNFKQVLNSILKQQSQKVYDIIIESVKSDDSDDEVTFEKLNHLIELY